ncbi:DUF998 domain-containing protein [Amycolatopsis sp. NPDC049688]|uniref:DUF998 domain-containing protein n=1 Tax=Amycolatopsis sp. NPDC049688 TaxID=3154733 RepID=UPI003426E9BE
MTPRTATLSLVMATAAQAIIAGLTFGLAGHVDPWRAPVSDYAWHRGGGLLFTLALLLLLAAAAALAAAARSAALPRDPLASTLFLLWTAGIAVVLLFRSNFDAVTLSGEIHRAGGAVLFASLPLAAWTLSARLRTEPPWMATARALRRGAIAGVVTAAGFGLAQVVGWLPAGLLERAALLAEFAIVATMAIALRRAVRPPAVSRQSETAATVAESRRVAR